MTTLALTGGNIGFKFGIEINPETLRMILISAIWEFKSNMIQKEERAK